jgi:hypothetical protein
MSNSQNSSDIQRAFGDFPEDITWDREDLPERPSTQHAAEGTGSSGAAEVADSTPFDEQALASLLTEYIAGPTPSPVMGTFDGQPIELTEENKAWMTETSKAAGRGLTIKGKRHQHYMTFSPPHSDTATVFVASTPPETPPREPSPVPVLTARRLFLLPVMPVTLVPVFASARTSVGIAWQLSARLLDALPICRRLMLISLLALPAHQARLLRTKWSSR